MSKMKDLWGDTIEVTTDEGLVNISCTELLNLSCTELYCAPSDETRMELDVALTRKLIKKLKKAIAEVEDM